MKTLELTITDNFGDRHQFRGGIQEIVEKAFECGETNAQLEYNKQVAEIVVTDIDLLAKFNDVIEDIKLSFKYHKCMTIQLAKEFGYAFAYAELLQNDEAFIKVLEMYNRMVKSHV